MFSGQFTLCYRKEGEKLLNCLSVWLGKKSVPNPNAASNLRTALIKLCGQTSKREFSRWYSYLLSSVQSYPLLDISQKDQKTKGKSHHFFSNKRKKIPLQQAKQSPDLIIFTVSVKNCRAKSRLRKCRTFCSLRVLWSNGLGFKVHLGMNSKLDSGWVPSFPAHIHACIHGHTHCREILQKVVFKGYIFKRELILLRHQLLKRKNRLSNQTAFEKTL